MKVGDRLYEHKPLTGNADWLEVVEVLDKTLILHRGTDSDIDGQPILMFKSDWEQRIKDGWIEMKIKYLGNAS